MHQQLKRLVADTDEVISVVLECLPVGLVLLSGALDEKLAEQSVQATDHVVQFDLAHGFTAAPLLASQPSLKKSQARLSSSRPY
jgi:hypothetical protein